MRLRAAVGRRVVGHLADRGRAPTLLSQARAAAIESGAAVGSTRCPQRIRMAMAEARRKNLPRCGAEAGGARSGSRPVRYDLSRSRGISDLEEPAEGRVRSGTHRA